MQRTRPSSKLSYKLKLNQIVVYCMSALVNTNFNQMSSIKMQKMYKKLQSIKTFKNNQDKSKSQETVGIPEDLRNLKTIKSLLYLQHKYFNFNF